MIPDRRRDMDHIRFRWSWPETCMSGRLDSSGCGSTALRARPSSSWMSAHCADTPKNMQMPALLSWPGLLEYSHEYLPASTALKNNINSLFQCLWICSKKCIYCQCVCRLTFWTCGLSHLLPSSIAMSWSLSEIARAFSKSNVISFHNLVIFCNMLMVRAYCALWRAQS